MTWGWTAQLGNIGIGQLIAAIDRSWDTRAEIRAKIGERLAAMKERARRTNELLVDILRRRPGERTAVEPTPVSH